ncbi:hypothetical protein [Actinokineospora pegani]|uniref:hypothetical protein n=1 Tax=Actinokineospora pegani TaxID=2654637 RepID=UPI0012EA9737|nr:hypothetical protein [Actinokineospora pegani]
MDPEVVHGRDVERYAAQFAPGMREDIRSDVVYRTAVAAGHRLLDVPVKATGTMTFGVGQPGELVVRTEHSFAYAFQPPDPERVTDTMDIVSIVRVSAEYSFYRGNWEPEGLGLWLTKTQVYLYSAQCAAANAGYLAPAISDTTTAERLGDEEEVREQVFDPAQPPPTETNC